MNLRASRLVAPLLVVLVVGGLLIGRPWTWCPVDWTAGPVIQLGDSSGDVVLGGRPYRVGGDALLDYSLRALITPLDQWLYQLRGEQHPLIVIASISAASPDALGDPVFTCFRVTRGTEVWSRRPTTHSTQSMADAYPPGASPPVENEAWRQAYVSDGPEWPAGELVSLEVWVNVKGTNYVLRIPPLRLAKGG